MTDEKRYDEFLNEVYGTVKIGGYEYDTSTALKRVDPTAYQVGMADWLSDQPEIDEVESEVNGEAES